MVGELLLKLLVRPLGACHHHQAGCFHIQAMNDEGIHLIVPAFAHELFHRRAVNLPWHTEHAGRFYQHSEGGVFVEKPHPHPLSKRGGRDFF